jgi:signal transduction histidine kinase
MGKIIVVTKKDNNWAKIIITDFGMGISNADLPHIFDRFYRAETSRTKTLTPGFGLGLSIAKDIVKQSGGKIEVNSQENKGSTFSILLPINYQ